MTKNMEIAFDTAQKQVDECQKIINRLTVLRDVYEKIDSEEIYVLVDQIRIKDADFPIFGLFNLVPSYRSVTEIDKDIEVYQDFGKQWIRLRNQLGQD